MKQTAKTQVSVKKLRDVINQADEMLVFSAPDEANNIIPYHTIMGKKARAFLECVGFYGFVDQGRKYLFILDSTRERVQ